MIRSWTAIILLSSELFLEDEFESSEIDFSFRIDDELELFLVDLGGFAGAFIDPLLSKRDFILDGLKLKELCHFHYLDNAIF